MDPGDYNIGYFVDHRFVDVSSKIKQCFLGKSVSWASNIQMIEYKELAFMNPFYKVFNQSLKHWWLNIQVFHFRYA